MCWPVGWNVLRIIDVTSNRKKRSSVGQNEVEQNMRNSEPRFNSGFIFFYTNFWLQTFNKVNIDTVNGNWKVVIEISTGYHRSNCATLLSLITSTFDTSHKLLSTLDPHVPTLLLHLRPQKVVPSESVFLKVRGRCTRLDVTMNGCHLARGTLSP